ncbi:MAG: SMI1/KNR4 family protein [Sporichthyaceae bacterium]
MKPGAPVPDGATPEAIAVFETEIGRTLSASMRTWLGCVNGAAAGPGGLFGIRDRRDSSSLRQMFEIFPDWLELGWMPIAGDGCGNFYVELSRGAGAPGGFVAFVECVVDPLEIVYWAASDCLHFVEFLLEDDLRTRPAVDSRRPYSQAEFRARVTAEIPGTWPFDPNCVLARDPAMANAPTDFLPWNVD